MKPLSKTEMIKVNDASNTPQPFYFILFGDISIFLKKLHFYYKSVKIVTNEAKVNLTKSRTIY